PTHYAIAPVRSHDYEAFYRAELAHRAALAYPPCGRLVHVLVSGPEEAAAAARAARLADVARRAAERAAGAPAAAADDRQAGPPAGEADLAAEVLGPAPAPLARLRDRFRFQLLVKGRDEKRVLAAGRALAEAAAAAETGGLRVVVDPNPVNML